MPHKSFYILFLLILVLAVNTSFADKGKVGSMAQLDSGGKTALMIVVLKGKTKIVHLLLSKGADIDQQDKAGYTALDLVSKARLQNNNIDYRDVYNILRRGEHEKDDKSRTLKSREKVRFE